MKTVAIIQARMTSTRLPGKILADLAGRPLLYHVVARARQSMTLDLVAVATTDRVTDDVTAQYCNQLAIPYFRGSEDDVLDRYYQAAKLFKADVIVRLTADCPLIDPNVIDRTVQLFKSGDYDYVSNTLERTYPDGLDVEVFSKAVLERTWREASWKSECEHVTPYMRNPILFRLGCLKHDSNHSGLRWTVDHPRDLEFVRRVYDYLCPAPSFGLIDILALLREHPELSEINTGIETDEGYHRSLSEDVRISKRKAK